MPTISDCYTCLGIIHCHYKPLQGRIKDYIAHPKPNRYQSLHTTIFDKDGAIISYLWDFGDGTTGMGRNTTHIYKKPGEYQVILVVTDNNGNRDNKTIMINVGLNLGGTVSDEQLLNPILYLRSF